VLLPVLDWLSTLLLPVVVVEVIVQEELAVVLVVLELMFQDIH
jgi:hypothetical protein